MLKNPNGKTYVYENITRWNKELKKSEHERKCIGHLEPGSKQIVPNRKKKQTQLPVLDTCGYKVQGVGIHLLLDRIATDTGLSKVLRQTFPDDYDRILACAYFLVSEGRALCRVESWMNRHKSPFDTPLSSQRISELLPRITPSMQEDFFSLWISHNSDDQYYCLDITSVSCYSELLEFVRYGYNRDREELAQINLLMVTGENSHLPIYYRIMPGSIHDVSTLEESLMHMDLMDARQLHLVMDKGFYSGSNVDAMYARHVRFMIGVPFTCSLAREAVEKRRREDMISHRNYCMVMGDELYAQTELIKWNGHRCYVHTYFDSFRAEAENKKFNHKLLICYQELKEGKRVKKHETDYKKFFIVKETPKRGFKIEYNEEAIREHRNNTSGWFVMITNDVKDPVRALEIYRRKDAVEKGFDDLKNDLDMKRLRIHSTAAMDGRMFLQYIAMILTAKIKTIMNEHGMFKKHDMQEVIDEMKSLRSVTLPGKKKPIYTTPTAFQSEIMQVFDLEV